jgi:hypothetical protein
MNLPEQELFTVEDVAARWNKPVSYVQDLNRRNLLIPTRVSITMPNKLELKHGNLPPIRYYYMRKDLEAFEREHAVAPPPPPPPTGLSIKEYMRKYDVSYRTVDRAIKKKKLNAKKIHGRWMIFD